MIVLGMEPLGALAYSLPVSSESKSYELLQKIFSLLNYLKVGFTYGLFVDAFKVGS